MTFDTDALNHFFQDQKELGMAIQRQLVEKGMLVIKSIHSEDNSVDILTYSMTLELYETREIDEVESCVLTHASTEL